MVDRLAFVSQGLSGLDHSPLLNTDCDTKECESGGRYDKLARTDRTTVQGGFVSLQRDSARWLILNSHAPPVGAP